MPVSKTDVNINIFRLNYNRLQLDQADTNINKIPVNFLLIPQEYHEWSQFFENVVNARALPKHQPWDHEIKLLPGTTPPFEAHSLLELHPDGRITGRTCQLNATFIMKQNNLEIQYVDGKK